MLSFHLSCPYCGKKESFYIRQVAGYVSPLPIPVGNAEKFETQRDGALAAKNMRVYGVASCPRCHGPVMIWFECVDQSMIYIHQSSEDKEWCYDGLAPKVLSVWPKPEEPDDSPHYPEALRQVFIELQEDVKDGRTASRIVFGCRGVLEVALEALGYDEKMGALIKRIDKAREDGVLTESMRKWAHRIRLDGNEAAHKLTASNEDAKEFVDFLRLFLEVAFVLPARIPAPRE